MSITILLNNLEKISREQLLSALDGLLNKKDDDWWNVKVRYALNDNQLVYAKEEELSSLDLNGLVSVFNFNYRDFLQKKEINNWELDQLSRSVRSIRNYLAHLNTPIEIALTSEKTILYLLTYKNFIIKITEIVTSKSHEIIKEINTELISQMERFIETYSNKQTITFEKKINDQTSYSDIMNKLNQLSSEIIKNRNQNFNEDNSQDNNMEIFINETLEEKIDNDEARDLLIGLRDQIRRIYQNIPREKGILTDNIINYVIKNNINSKGKFNLMPNSIIGKIDNRQFNNLDDIINIIKKIKQI